MSKHEEILEAVAELNPEAIKFINPSYKSAIVGYTHDYRLVYE